LALLLAAPAGAEGDRRVAQAETNPPETNQPESKSPERPEAKQPEAAKTRAEPPDSDIEEIVVLGSESDSSSDFAAGDSVTGFGAEDIAALGAQSIADLASFTPNLEIVTANATTPTFFIRGVGLNDFNPNSTGAVAIYQDDVAINAPAIQLPTLFDVEGVNVLRGPQGTGLARNASAGAIKVYSRKPTGQFGGFFRTDFGNFNYHDYEGAVEAPIWEDLLSGRFAFRLTQRDGIVSNRCADAPPFSARAVHPPGQAPTALPWSICGEPVPNTNAVSDIPVGLEKNVNDTNNWAARGTLLFQPTLDMTWLVNAHGARRDEITRLGQSIPTGGSYCIDPNAVCQPPGFPPANRSFQTSGWLGGSEPGSPPASNYQPIEIKARLQELLPCNVPALFGSGTYCQAGQPLAVRLQANKAQIQLSEELAEHLDSRPWEGDYNYTGPTHFDAYGGYLKGNLALPYGLELGTTTGYDNYDRSVAIDLDFSPVTLFHIKTKDNAWQIYQDASLKGRLLDRVDWEVGAYLLHEKLDATVDNDFGQLQATGVTGRVYSQDTWSTAGYGYFSFDFWDDFTLDGGVRYNWEKKEFDMRVIGSTGAGVAPTNCMVVAGDVQCPLSDTWQAPTGTLRLTYRFRQDTQAYWKYTRGWKPGTYNATASQNTGPSIADPETLDAWETGLSGVWLGGRIGIDASLFYYSYSDYQIFTAQQYLGGNPEFVILNANDAEVYGSEIDAIGRPWQGFFLNVRFSWLKSQFLDFVRTDQFLNTTGGGGDIVRFKQTQNSGNPLLNSPEYKVSITAEQTLPLGSGGRYGYLVGRYDVVWTDKSYYDASKGVGLGDENGNYFLPNSTIAQDPFWVHNIRLAWRAPGGRVEIAGWGRNLTNEAYKTFAFDGSTFRRTTIYYVGDPRTYGGSLVVTF